jgi:glycosyltransferase involved in cell wall biosynthesis
MSDDKVSIVIPTFNRFKYVLNTIKSVKEQTYKNIEIIVVNDCSTEKEYYEYDWSGNNVIIIHIEQNTKKTFGHPNPGYVRNRGIEISTGKYVAFCDDDDIWLPNKLELQIDAMKRTGCKISSTEAFIGYGIYNPEMKYKKFLAEFFYQDIINIFKSKGNPLMDNGFPPIWNLEFLKGNNCMICSSVVVEKEILNKINNMRHGYPGFEDYDCWLRSLEHTNNVFVPYVCMYYDRGHGHGSNYF